MAKQEIRSPFDIKKQDLLDILDKFFRRYETQNLFNWKSASTWKDLKAEPVPGARIFIRATEAHLEGEYTLFRDARTIALEVSPHKVEVVLLSSTRAEREAARQDEPPELRAQRMVVPDAIAGFAFAAWDSLETLYQDLVDYIREELGATGEQAAPTEPATPGKLVQDATPTKPGTNESLDKWFEYYHNCKKHRIKYSLKDLARDVSHAYGYIRQQHARYQAEHGDEQNT